MYAELKVEFDSNEINFQQSSNLQGVLMENISSEYAEKLHGNQLNPYSQCILKEEGKTIWYLKTLNTEAYEMLLLPMTKLDTITLRKKNKTVNLLNKTVRIKEDKELIKEFYENKCSRYLELSFKTPTSFKRDGKYVIYPDLSLIYGSLPEDEELEDILKGATYSLLKRSGFIDSQTYATQQMRKSDIYVFSAGSCFVNTFKGKVIEERNGGTHPIFRYAKAFFMGV